MPTANYIKIGNDYYAPTHPKVKAQLSGVTIFGCVGSVTEPLKVKKRLRQSSRTMNKLESDFQDHLKALHANENIYYEPIRLALGSGVVYIPDFLVINALQIPQVTFFEVKSNRPIEDDSSVKMKVAAHQYPLFKFILVWREGVEWQEQEILS